MSIEFVYGNSDGSQSELAILEGESISYGTEPKPRKKFLRLRNAEKLRPMSELLGASAVVTKSKSAAASTTSAAASSANGSRSGASSGGSVSYGSSSGSRSSGVSVSSGGSVNPSGSRSQQNPNGSRSPVVVPVSVSSGSNEGSRGALVINPADGSRGVLIVPVSNNDTPGGAGNSDSGGAININSFGLAPSDPHGSRNSDSGDGGDGSGGSSSVSNRGGGYAPGSGNDLFLGAGRTSSKRSGTSVHNNKGMVLYPEEETTLYSREKALHIPVKLRKKGRGKYALRKDPDFETVLGAFPNMEVLKKKDLSMHPRGITPMYNRTFSSNPVVSIRNPREAIVYPTITDNAYVRTPDYNERNNSFRRFAQVMEGLEGEYNRILDIKIKHLIKPDEMPRVRQFLENIAKETQLLGDEEILNMNDQELLGFFKKLWGGIKKAATGVWKGVKSVGKFVGKNVGKVASGVWKGVKAVGNVVGKVASGIGKGIVKVASTIGKGLWAGVQAVGNGLLAVGKFAWQNALPLLSGVVSFLPGGSLISGLIDTISGITSGSPSEEEQMQMQQQAMYDQQMQEQAMYDQQMQEQAMYDQQMQQQAMYDQQMQQQQQQAMYDQQMQQQYIPQMQQQYFPQMSNVMPNYNTNEYYANYEDIPNDEYVDYSESDNYEPEYSEYSEYENEEMMGNLLTDLKTAITKGVNWIKNPVNRVKAANFMNLSAQEQIRIQTELKNLDAKSKEQVDAWQAELGLKSKGDSFFSTYGTWIALGLVGVILIMNR